MLQKKLKKNNINNYSLIDLFCGVGGLTHGFVQENFKIDAGIDFDATCKFAFEITLRFMQMMLRYLKAMIY